MSNVFFFFFFFFAMGRQHVCFSLDMIVKGTGTILYDKFVLCWNLPELKETNLYSPNQFSKLTSAQFVQP